MNFQNIVICIFALLLGMLIANMLNNICGCKSIEGQTPCNPNITPSQLCPGGEKCPKTGKCPPYTPPPPSFTNKGPAGSKFTCQYPDAKPGDSNWCDIPSFISSKEDNGCPGAGNCTDPKNPFRISGGGCSPWAGKNKEPTQYPCYLYWYKGGCLSPETTIQYKKGTIDNIPLIIDNEAKKGEDYGQGQVAYMKWAQELAGCGDPSRPELIEKFIKSNNGKYSALKDSKGDYKPISSLKKGVNPFKWPDQYNCTYYKCNHDGMRNDNKTDHAGNPLKCRNSNTQKTCNNSDTCNSGTMSSPKNTNKNSTGCCFNGEIPDDAVSPETDPSKENFAGQACCDGYQLEWDEWGPIKTNWRCVKK